MEVVLWILILLSFVLAFVGLIKPIIPSVLVLWVGFLIYQFGFSQDGLSWIFYVAMILFTVFIFKLILMINTNYTDHTELVQDFDFGKALKASIGSVVAFLASSVAQALIMFIMVIWFFIDVFLVG